MKVRAQVKIDKISMEYNREGFQEYINRDLKMSWAKEALKHLKVETSTVNDDNMRFETKTITAGVFSKEDMNEVIRTLARLKYMADQYTPEWIDIVNLEQILNK